MNEIKQNIPSQNNSNRSNPSQNAVPSNNSQQVVPDNARTFQSTPAVDSAHSTRGFNENDSIASQGEIVLREVPDDNSCLFRSLNALLGDPSRSPVYLRQIVAKYIMSNQHEFSEAVLGRTHADYSAWMLSDHAWGGPIELSILARHFRVQFAAFDVRTMRLDLYDENVQFPTVAYLMYDGIHYNYTALSLMGASTDADITQFDPADHYVRKKVRELAQHLHDSKSFTNTASFSLVCEQCGVTMEGQQQALDHASSTGHTQFGEK